MEVSEQIIEVLDYLGEKLGFSIDWTSENVLPYVQTLCDKYIRWEITTSIIWIFFGLVFIMLSIMSFKQYKKYENQYKLYEEDKNTYKKYENCNETCDGFIFLFIISLIIGTVIIMCQTFDIVKCICIPELQIYEYIKSIM